MNVVEKVAQSLTDRTHAALVTSQISRRYVTGFKSSDGIVIVTKDQTYYIVDARYFEKASESVKNCKVVLLSNIREQINRIFAKHSIKTVFVESHEMTVSELSEYKARFSQVEFDSSDFLSSMLEKMRIVKTAEEISFVESAQRVAERAFAKLISKMRSGMTEKQVAAILNYYMMDYGADEISFDTIAASGKNSACPHAVPTDKKIEDGEFLTLDFGAVINGYHSDMTRTVCFGKPTENMKEVYDAVWGANADALKAVRAGISGKLVDNVARSTLDAWGYEQYFTHGLGHGVGLEIHEAPSLSAHSDITLREGMIVTVEPGVYIPHKYGVRIEDMVLVTSDGCRNLTKTQKTLLYI